MEEIGLRQRSALHRHRDMQLKFQKENGEREAQREAASPATVRALSGDEEDGKTKADVVANRADSDGGGGGGGERRTRNRRAKTGDDVEDAIRRSNHLAFREFLRKDSVQSRDRASPTRAVGVDDEKILDQHRPHARDEPEERGGANRGASAIDHDDSNNVDMSSNTSAAANVEYFRKDDTAAAFDLKDYFIQRQQQAKATDLDDNSYDETDSDASAAASIDPFNDENQTDSQAQQRRRPRSCPKTCARDLANDSLSSAPQLTPISHDDSTSVVIRRSKLTVSLEQDEEPLVVAPMPLVIEVGTPLPDGADEAQNRLQVMTLHLKQQATDRGVPPADAAGGGADVQQGRQPEVPPVEWDERGRCRSHPWVRLRKKRFLRGWTVLLDACPECAAKTAQRKRSIAAGKSARIRPPCKS